jgi:putative component of toxin-antitoxin plasmid stabilization module
VSLSSAAALAQADEAGVVPSLEERQRGEGGPPYTPDEGAKKKVSASILQLKAGVGEKVGGLFTLLNLLKDVAGGVKDVAQSAAQGVRGGAGALIGVALDGLLLRGIADPDLRAIISGALKAVASQLSKKNFTLRKGVIEVLKSLARDNRLGALVAKEIPITALKPVVQQGVKTVLRSLANDAGVSKLMGNPLGFLTEVGAKLIRDLKVKLARAIVSLVQVVNAADKARLEADLVKAIGKLEAAIRKKSFAELLSFGKSLGTLLVRGLYDQFIKLLGSNVKVAKANLEKLVELAGAIPGLPKTVLSMARGVIKGLESGATKFVGDAAACRQFITALDGAALKGVFGCLKQALRTGVGAVGAGIAKSLYDEFIKLLRDDRTLAQAKAKLKALAAMLPNEVKPVAKLVVDEIGVGARQFVDDAAMCGSVITGVNLASARALFRCLKLALRQGVKAVGGSVARKAFDAFVAMLRKNVVQAKALLQRVAQTLVTVLPGARSVVTEIAAAIGPQTTRAIADIAACGGTLKTLDLESVRGFFSCLRLAVRSATQVGAAKFREYFGKFVRELRGNANTARIRLRALAKALRPYVPQAVSLLQAVAGRIGAPSAELSQTAAICTPILTVVDSQSVLGLARCLELAFRGTQPSE